MASASSLSSSAVTHEIRVEAFPFYVPEQSTPEKREYLFSYRIVITNEGSRTVRLLSRHWVIINAEGTEREVRGPGVVGKRPLLRPGGQFEYVSFCPLDTEWGTMEGEYEMKSESGEVFLVSVARFFLTTTAPVMAPPAV
jgi:ApaG protein